jgi:hypothetical protein
MRAESQLPAAHSSASSLRETFAAAAFLFLRSEIRALTAPRATLLRTPRQRRQHQECVRRAGAGRLGSGCAQACAGMRGLGTKSRERSGEKRTFLER